MLKKALAVLALAASAVALTNASAYAANPAVTIYDAAPITAQPNVPSVGFEATQASEFGDEITFAPGTPRSLGQVSVTMSSWACMYGAWNTNDCATPAGSKYTIPITLTIYEESSEQNDGTFVPGDVIAKVTKPFSLPYRPSAAVGHCNASNNSLGKWWDKASNTCYNGRAAKISYNFRSLGLLMPETVVIGVSYNTSNYGYHPVGTSTACYGTAAGCFYDSLNVGTDTVTTGSKPHPDTVFYNSDTRGQYCDGTPALGEFNLDSPTDACWGGYDAAITVTASNPQ